jgi:hypothetical protein
LGLSRQPERSIDFFAWQYVAHPSRLEGVLFFKWSQEDFLQPLAAFLKTG